MYSYTSLLPRTTTKKIFKPTQAREQRGEDTLWQDVLCVYKAKVCTLFCRFLLINRCLRIMGEADIQLSSLCYTTKNRTVNEIAVLSNGTALPRAIGKLPPDVVDDFIVELLNEPTKVWSWSSPSTRTSAIPLCMRT